MLPTTLKLLQDNFTAFINNDMKFLENLDSLQIIEILKCTNNLPLVPFSIISTCFYCFQLTSRANNYLGNRICDNCIKKMGLIDLQCCRIEKHLDLKNHIVCNFREEMICINVRFVGKSVEFFENALNVEWYHHCFGKKIIIEKEPPKDFIFELKNDDAYYLFMKITRFNHHENFIAYDNNVNCNTRNYTFCYKTLNENESSVEKIMKIIITALIIFRKRVPKFLKREIIEWYLI